MKITVHRGSNQIGGCVTEYESNGWKLFVDYGEQLPGAPMSDKKLEIDGLTCGDLRKSALLVTHYHGDHIGKITELPSDLPIYMGKIAKEIASQLANHLSVVSEEHQQMSERLKSVTTFTAGELFSFGEFNILPIVIDHSAFDAYAFSIEAKELKVFHTGDFRTHGFRSGKLPKVIDKYVGRADYVVCEATNISRPDATPMPEYLIKRGFGKAFTENKYNVVYVSSTNIDRLFGLYHAALKAHRPFYVDAYQKQIMDIVAGKDPIWGKSPLYKYEEGREPKTLIQRGAEFVANDKFIDYVSEHGYVLVARQGERFDKLLSKLHDFGRVKYLSMWDGYLDESKAAYNPTLAKSVGTEYRYMHTSGHCDMKGLDELFSMLAPKAIIPIHTDNPQAFADLFCDKWPVILLNDGEYFAAIRDPWFDITEAKILAYKQPDKSHRVIENSEVLRYWSLDERSLGEFQCWKDAEFALHHVVYAPNRVLAYSIETDDDMAPDLYVVYTPDFAEYSEYSEGEHEPGGNNYQEKCAFSSGDKVLAIIESELLMPCTFVGPTSDEFFKECHRKDGVTDEKKIDEFVSDLWDWDWDSVVVKPLIKIETGLREVPSETTAQRIYVFPYKELELKIYQTMSKTMILAIGDAGCNMAETIMRVANAHWIKEATYLFADSDMERLSELGKKGFETLQLQRESDIFPTEKLKGVEKLYILAGLGGVTGSKFAEIAAKSAKSEGVGNVAFIVTLPFIFEGTGKMAKATESLKSLSDIPIKVLNNEDLTERYPDLNFINAFEYSDKEALNAMESGLI